MWRAMTFTKNETIMEWNDYGDEKVLRLMEEWRNNRYVSDREILADVDGFMWIKTTDDAFLLFYRE